MNAQTFIIAIAAGIASALMIIASTRMGASGIPLLLAAPLPIYIAALSWGTISGMTASIIAIIVTSFLVAPSTQIAVMVGLLFTIPASIIGHQANLAQPSGNGAGMVWYPVSSLLFNLAMLIAIGIVVSGYFSGYRPEDMLTPMTEFTRDMLKINPPEIALSDTEIIERARMTIAVLPFVFSGMWLAVHCVNIQIAALISRASDKMPRPRDDIPQTVGLPKSALLILFASLLLALYLDAPYQLAAAVFAGTFMMAFAMTGLAVLHLQVRNNSAWLVLLFLSYIMILLIYLPLILFAVIGIIRTSLNSPKHMPPRRPGNT